MKKFIKTALPLIMALCLLTAAVIPSIAADGGPLLTSSGAAHIDGREEVVYATLNADGSSDSVYVVSMLNVSAGGSFRESGVFTSVKNLTDTSPLVLDSGSVSGSASEGLFYYQGSMGAAVLPWSVSVRYFLDGKEYSAKDIAGKSGELEIRIKTAKSAYADPTFYENYMLQVQVTLDMAKCSAIKSEGATLANAGGSKYVTFTVMPESDSELSLTASVKDFEMPGIQITGLPFSFSLDLDAIDSGKITDEFSELTDAIDELNDGVGEFLDGVKELKDGTSDLLDGIDELSDGTGELRDGSAEILDGVHELSGNSSKLTDASAEILDALKKINDGLADVDFSQLEQLSELGDGLIEIAFNLDLIAGGMEQLNAQIKPIVLQAAAEAQNPSAATITLMTAIGTIKATLAANPAAYDANVQTLLAAYEAQAQSMKGIMQLLAATGDALTASSAGIRTIADQLDKIALELHTSSDSGDEASVSEQLNEMKDGLKELFDGYTEFHDGLTEYTDGVKELGENYGEFDGGVKEFDDGVKELRDGVKELDDGVADLTDGAQELKDGTQEMYDETRDIDKKISDKIDEMISDYSSSDFTPVSFVNGGSADSVQFVITTAAVEVEEPEAPAKPAEKEQTFWERLFALFS